MEAVTDFRVWAILYSGRLPGWIINKNVSVYPFPYNHFIFCYTICMVNFKTVNRLWKDWSAPCLCWYSASCPRSPPARSRNTSCANRNGGKTKPAWRKNSPGHPAGDTPIHSPPGTRMEGFSLSIYRSAGFSRTGCMNSIKRVFCSFARHILSRKFSSKNFLNILSTPLFAGQRINFMGCYGWVKISGSTFSALRYSKSMERNG